MKDNTRSILAAALAASLALAAVAAPAGRQIPITSKALRTTEEFQKLKAGDTIALVCKECDTVTVRELESDEAGMGLCKENHTVTCPSCKKDFKIVRRQGPRLQATGSRIETRYVNADGKECMFVAKLNQ